jgi:O-antigen ligase
MSKLTSLVIIAIPITASLGPHLMPIGLFGVNVFGYRLLTVALFCLTVISSVVLGGKLFVGNRLSRYYLALMAFWLVYGTASLLWTPDRPAGIRELLSVGVGLVIHLVLLGLVRDSRECALTVAWGWAWAVLGSVVLAAWEIRTGNHLSGYYVEHAQRLPTGLAIATFGNPEGLSAFAVLAFPFLVWLVLTCRGTKRIFASVLAFVGTPALLVVSGGMLSFLGFSLEIVVLLLLCFRRRSVISLLVPALLVTSVVLASFVAVGETPLFSKMESRLGLGLQNSESILVRLRLTWSGLTFLVQSFGFGIGAGGFERSIEQRAVFNTNNLTNPHNFWIEVLSQYGLPVFVPLFAWFVSVVRMALRLRRKARTSSPVWSLSTTILIALVGYVPAAAEGSSFVDSSINFVFLASICVLVGTATAMARSPEGSPG